MTKTISPIHATSSSPAPRVTRPQLGEELPVFCERCGYPLHGLPQVRCDHCAILQFHCPECGHHQPINTLRPAAMAVLGRIRAFVLVLLVIVKIAFFIGMTIAAWGIGIGNSYRYNEHDFVAQNAAASTGGGYVEVGPRRIPTDVRIEHVIPIPIFAIAYGLLGRMLLLRWRRAWLVGLALGVLTAAMYALGAFTEWRTSWNHTFPYASPYTLTFIGLIACWAGATLLGCLFVWPIWVMLVRAFLPTRASKALLDWQRAMSNPGVDGNRAVATLAT